MFRRLTARASVLAPVVLVAAIVSGCSDSTLPTDFTGPGTGGALSNEDTAFRRDGTGKNRPGAGNAPATLEITPASMSIAVGDAADLTAVLRSRNGHPAERAVSWQSTDETVASVDGGRLHALKAGTTLVIASADGISDTATATVTQTAAAVDSVIVSPDTANVVVGQTLALDARPVDSTGVALANRPISWTTSNSAIARIEAGKVTGVAAGRAILKASADGESTEVPVTVAEAPAVPVATVTVTPSPATVREDATVQLTAVTEDADGNALTGRSVTWATSNDAVAKVSSTGLVTGTGAGSATITATSEGQSGTSTVEVTPSTVAVASVTMSRSTASIEVGATVQLVATPRDASGSALAGRTIRWTSSDAAAATVSSSGLVKGVGAGAASITATVEGKAGATAVTVTAPAPQPEPDPTPEPEPTPTDRVGYYVAPNGSSGGSGGKSSPWDLASVLQGGKSVAAGDTVWVRGGTYRGEFISYLNGASGRLIVVRAYPGERATIDGNLAIVGSYTAFWGLEVMNSNPNRFSANGYGKTGINMRAPGSKLINMVVHDIGHTGIGAWREAQDAEIYGTIVYNAGWNIVGDNSGSGHSLYIHNLEGRKLVRHNIMFNSFGYGIHAWQGADQYVRHITFDENTVFNSGTLAVSPRPDYMGVSGSTAADDLVFTENMSYRNNPGEMTLRLPYGGSGHGSLAFTGNYMVGTQMFTPGSFASNVVSGNTFLTSVSSTSNRIVVQPNAYERGRANIVVYNWSGAGAVSADLSNVLAVGDAYEVRNVQDFYGTPVVTGTFGGGSITIPVRAVPGPTVIGGSNRAPQSTGTEFNVYVVLKR